jgi:L-aminopeptidase/D-esterase-like protein
LARTGSVAHHGSGEIFLAFSTARGGDRLADHELDLLFAATADATEEAVATRCGAPSASSVARAASSIRCRKRT